MDSEASSFETELKQVNKKRRITSVYNDPPNETIELKQETGVKDSCASRGKLVPTEADRLCLEGKSSKGLIGCSRRKLLVLDLNGILADIVTFVEGDYEPDVVVGIHKVFKRPHLDDFLQVCFEKFDVGIWSSRTKRNLDTFIDLLMGENKSKLLFCWDQSHCTDTGYKTIGHIKKPLLLKELKKLWERHEPGLSWEIGDYDESSTLLIDDSPYKALKNPPNTAIFPDAYHYMDDKDNSLGAGGDLQVYLERLSMADSVQKYVEQNPYGQKPITESHTFWHFYAEVIGKNLDLKHTSNENKETLEWPESEHMSSEDIVSAENSEPLSNWDRLTRGQHYEEINWQYTTTREPLHARGGNPCPQQMAPCSFGRALAPRSKRKLLILDANGLLIDIYNYEPFDFRPDTTIGGKAVFRRPFTDEFLRFCFERFNVGFWLTTSRQNAKGNLEFLLGEKVQDLLFTWDMNQCFMTEFHTLSNRKNIIVKELKKLWDKVEPNLPWHQGEYNETNTLLVDVYPHAALLNPPHTAIFPYKYRYRNREDKFLEPGGAFQQYLEGVALANNVQEYVKNNPRGQQPITERHPRWDYYRNVKETTQFRLDSERQTVPQ